MAVLQTKLRVKDNRTRVIARNAMAMDMGLAHMAQDIEIGIKTGGRTPFDKGALRGRTYHQKKAVLKYEVVAPVEYASVQEAGVRAGARPFTNYTTAGTGKGWFRGAVDNVVRGGDNYFRQAVRSVGL